MSGKGDKSKKVGFYVALAVCLVAVGIAAWSTYDAVQGYAVGGQDLTQAGNTSMADKAETSKANDKDEDGEAVNRSKAESSSKPESSEEESKDVTETAGKVESAPEPSETEESKSSFISQPQEYGTPVNAGTVYEISAVMIYPVASEEIQTAYSAGLPVFSPTMKDWRIHNGMDIKAEDGETVKACANGIVKQAYTDYKLGNVLVIEHGEYTFWYCGLGEEFLVKEGDVVSAGQEIGTVRAAPFESAEDTHIHLEVKRDDVYLNPIDVFNEHRG